MPELDSIEQEPQAPALSGDETATDISTDYSSARSLKFTSYLNRDLGIIKKLLLQVGGAQSGAALSCGRIVSGLNFATGRVVPPAPNGLFIRVPNGLYVISGKTIELEDLSGYTLLPVPANTMAFCYGSLDEDDNLELLPENILAPVTGGAPPSNAPALLPCFGKITTDATGVSAIDYLYTDEIMAPNKLLILHRLLQSQVEALSGVGGGGGEGTGGAGRADLLPWNLPEIGTDTVTKVLALLDGLRTELTDYVDNGRTRSMQTDNDHFVNALMAIYAEVARLSPHATDLVEAAMVMAGFAGHSLSGDYADPGVNGTHNYLLYTTFEVDAPSRALRPGA